MAFVSAKTGKRVDLKTGYSSNPVDYQTYVKQQEEKRRSTAASSAAVPKTETAAPKTKAKRESAGAAANTAAASSPEKSGTAVSAAAANRVEGLPSARPSSTALRNQLRQAQADLDTDAIMRLNRQLKEERARRGQQTFGDRASDVLSAAFGGSGAGLANLAGMGSSYAQDRAYNQRQAARLQAFLETGRSSDGKPLSDGQRETIRAAIDRLNKGENPYYQAADRMADTGAAFQESAKAGLGKVGSTVVDAAVSTSQSLLDSALGAVTGTGMLPFAARAFGGAAQEARRGGADLDQQLTYGSAQAAKEYVTEKLFGLSAPQRLIGGGSLDDAIETGIRKVTERLAKTPGGQKLLGGVLTWLGGGATEALEEGIGSVIENTLINPNLRDWDPDARTRQQKFEDGLYDMLVGGVSGLMGVTNLAQYQVSPDVRARYGPSGAETGRDARLEAGRGTDASPAERAPEAALTGPENIFTRTAQKEAAPGTGTADVSLVQRIREAIPQTQNMAPVAKLTGTEIPSGGKLVDRLTSFVNAIGGKVNRPGFGDVLFSRGRIKNSMIGHGFGQGKADTFAAVPAVIRDGVEIDHQTNWKGRNYETYTFAAPVDYRGQRTILGVIVTKDSQSSRYYVHEVVDADGNLLFKNNESPISASDGTSALSGDLDTVAAMKDSPEGTRPLSFNDSIPQGADSVKPGGMDGLGAADAGFTTRGMEGRERTSRMAQSHPYNKAQEAATAMTREEYDRLFRYQSQTEAKTTHLAEELVYVLQDGRKTFLKDVNEAAYNALTESLREATAWNAEQTEAAKMIELELLGRSYNGEITSEEYADWLKTVREHETAAGQGIQALAKWSRMDNDRGQATASQAVETIQNSRLSDAQKQARTQEVLDFTKRINDVEEGDAGRMQDIILEISKKRGTTTGPVAKRLDGALRKAMDGLTFQELKQFAFSSTEALSTDTKPLNSGEVIKTIQVLNMLSSLKTPGRNLTGNTAFYALDALSMDGAALLDMALSNVTGTRSVAMGGSPINRVMWENAIKSARMSTLETALDVDMGSGETMYGTGGQRTFRAGAQHEGKAGKALNFTERVLSALERNNSFLLTVPDEFFKGMARGNEANIQRLIDQGKIKTEDANYAKEQADELAKYRTFQDTNAASVISSTIHDLFNLLPGPGDSGKKMKGLTVHSFGVGDLVSPFSRVAANLAARGVDYNPVTAVRGVVEMGTILYDAKRGKTIDPARQAKAVSHTARGLSGTAVIGGFLALLSAGLIRRADDEGDENIAALNRSEGRTGYQFNLSAARRWMDGESQKWQNGDKLLDISSLQPFNELLGVADQIYHDEEKSLKSLLIDDVLGMMYAAADIPVLQTAGDLAKDLTLYKKDPVEAFTEAAVNTAVSSVTPNLLRSVAQGLDDRPRSINREDGLWRLIQDEFKSRTPGLRQTLPSGVDPTGQDKTYPGSRLGNFLNSTVNPMGLNTYEQTEQSREWQRLREETGRTDFYPSSRIPKKLEGNGLSKDLSYEQRQDFQRDRGIWLMLTVSDMMGNRGYQSSGSGRQSDLMRDARDFAKAAAKRAVLGPESVSKWVNGALEAQQETGLSPSAVIYYKDMLSREGSSQGSSEAKQIVRNAIHKDASLTAAQKNALDNLVISDVIVIPDDKNVD